MTVLWSHGYSGGEDQNFEKNRKFSLKWSPLFCKSYLIIWTYIPRKWSRKLHNRLQTVKIGQIRGFDGPVWSRPWTSNLKTLQNVKTVTSAKIRFSKQVEISKYFPRFDVLSRSLLTKMLEISENWNHTRHFERKLKNRPSNFCSITVASKLYFKIRRLCNFGKIYFVRLTKNVRFSCHLRYRSD